MNRSPLPLASHTGYASQVFDQLSYEGNSIDPSNFRDRTAYILTDRPELVRLESRLGPLVRDLSTMSDDQVASAVFYIYFTYDCDALPLLEEIIERGGIFVAPHPMMVAGKKADYCHGVNRLAHQALVKTWSKSNMVTHLHLDVHQNICEALDITQDLHGDFVEIGVYAGGSALTALNYIDEMVANNKIKSRHCWLLDTFDGFTYEEARSSVDSVWKNTHQLWGPEATQAHIRRVLADNHTPFSLHANNICRDDLPSGVGSVAVAHVDVDLYEATLAALQKIAPHMVHGGIILCEDPTSTPALYGSLLAMEQFLKSDLGRPFVKVFKGAHYFLIKIA